jgi:hypothetical protein
MSLLVLTRVRRSVTRGKAVAVLAGVGTLGLGAGAAAPRAAAPAPPSQRCVPAALNVSDVLPGTSLEVAPLPGSLDASPRTQISLLGVPPAQLSNVKVSGSVTHGHSGTLRAYSQGDGASFLPTHPFQPGETVTVSLTVAGHAASYSFIVSQPDPIKIPAAVKIASAPTEVQHFYSRPDLRPPTLAVTTPASAATAPGYIMATPYAGSSQVGPMIFDNSGQVVWFDPLPYGNEATNLQVQQLGGRPVLTWWQGYIPPQGFGEGVEMIANSAYQQTQVHAGNGFYADLHDFHLNPNNTAMMTVFNTIHCDLSSVGGSHSAAVTDGVFQEVDLATGLVRREWHSIDHVAMGDSYAVGTGSSTEWPFDYFHINSIDPLAEGNILLSARNTSTLYKLNGQTGQIIERIGGKHSTVKAGPDTTTAYQHDATLLPNGDISVFDNGGVPKVHPQSRGLLLAVNPTANTDSLVAQFTHPKPISSGSQGDIQQLPNGDFFLGWGPVPYFSEFSPSGQLLFDAHMAKSDQSYRGYRFQWEGQPTEAPAIAAATTAAKNTAGATGAATTVYASWNGATQVASWRVLAGASSGALAPVASAPRTGFETTIATPGAEGYVAVQALNASGAVLGTSRTIKG